MTIEELHQVIRGRRSVYPPQFLDKVIPDQLIRNMLENANWAPTHRLTQPWRFKVITGGARKEFGTFMAEKYRSTTDSAQFSISKYEKFKMNPQKAAAVIVICMQRDAKKRIPEWEEVASTAMAVQNMWLTAAAYGIGAYWSSPGLIEHYGDFDPLAEGEKCLGLFYMGYYQPVNAKPPRSPIEEKVKWIK